MMNIKLVEELNSEKFHKRQVQVSVYHSVSFSHVNQHDL